LVDRHPVVDTNNANASANLERSAVHAVARGIAQRSGPASRQADLAAEGIT
jgi:hypothetical protein